MRLWDISLQNIRKRPSRALLLVLCMAIGVASVIFLYTTNEALKWDVANKIDEYGSNIIILPENSQSLTFGGVTVETPLKTGELDLSLIPRMKTIENKETLAIISPKLLDSEVISGKQALLIGVQFKEELRLKKWWQLDKVYGDTPEARDLIVGSDAASSLNLKLDDLVTIKGQSFRVAGIIRPTGSVEDDQAIFMDLTTLQRLTGKDSAVSLIETAAYCYTCPIEEVTAQLREKLPEAQVLALKSTLETRNTAVNQFNLLALGISLLVLLASALVIMIAVKTSVSERTREIGILRAIGFHQSHIARIILWETGLLGLVGGMLGYLVGMGLAVSFGAKIVNITVPIHWQIDFLLYALAGSLVVALLAGLYPVWKAARLNPVDALRYL